MPQRELKTTISVKITEVQRTASDISMIPDSLGEKFTISPMQLSLYTMLLTFAYLIHTFYVFCTDYNRA